MLTNRWSFLALTILAVVGAVGIGLLPDTGREAPCAPAVARDPAEEEAAQEECIAHLKVLGPALMAYRRDHGGELPSGPRDLYPKYVDSEDVFFCPDDPKAPFLRDATSTTTGRPIYSSYLYQVAEALGPGAKKVGDIEIPAGEPFSKRIERQGDRLPIMVCDWHQEQGKEPSAPQLWIVLRLSGHVERVTKFVRNSEDL